MSRLYPPPAVETLEETRARWERERPAIHAAADAALAAARLADKPGVELDGEVDEWDRWVRPTFGEDSKEKAW